MLVPVPWRVLISTCPQHRLWQTACAQVHMVALIRVPHGQDVVQLQNEGYDPVGSPGLLVMVHDAVPLNPQGLDLDVALLSRPGGHASACQLPSPHIYGHLTMWPSKIADICLPHLRSL